MIRQKQGGFTLIEILIAVVIVGIMVSLVGPGIVRRFGGAKIGVAKSLLANIKGALIDFNMDMQRFPSEKEGLDALLRSDGVKGAEGKYRGPYISGQKELPTDPWGQDIIYNHPPKRFKDRYRQFELISLGPDMEESEDDISAGE